MDGWMEGRRGSGKRGGCQRVVEIMAVEGAQERCGVG